MKTIWNQFVNGRGCEINEFKGKKVKYTYEYGNAYERFKIEIFDGEKWNFVGGMLDIGAVPDNSTYIYDKSRITKRYTDLKQNADMYIKTLLS